MVAQKQQKFISWSHNIVGMWIGRSFRDPELIRFCLLSSTCVFQGHSRSCLHSNQSEGTKRMVYFFMGGFYAPGPKKTISLPLTIHWLQPSQWLHSTARVTGICNPCAFCTMKEGGHRFGMREMTTGYLCLRQETVSNFQQELVIHYCFIVHLCDTEVDVYFLCFLATYNLSSLNFLSLYSLFIIQLRSWNFLNHFYEDLND